MAVTTATHTIGVVSDPIARQMRPAIQPRQIRRSTVVARRRIGSLGARETQATPASFGFGLKSAPSRRDFKPGKAEELGEFSWQ
jgi:hypothetical protein